MSGCLIVILAIIVIAGLVSGEAWAWAVLLVLVVLIIIAAIQGNKDAEKAKVEQQERQLKYNEFLNKYNTWLGGISIPEHVKNCTYIRKSSLCTLPFINAQYMVFKEDGMLKFIVDRPTLQNFDRYCELNIISINLESIEYFCKQGEVYRENRISGGGGGGSSIGGAVVGGVVAGEAGAIIGSRKKNEEIKSEMVTHDSRETYINYFENNKRISIFFDINSYQNFNDIMPEKEYSIVSALKSRKIIEHEITKNSIEQEDMCARLEKLKDLYEKDLISEDEYMEKKKEILENL